MKEWILYDGRAEFGDEDDAWIIESIETRKDLRNAIYAHRGMDAVLFEYDSDGATLTNGVKVGHIRLGKKLLQMCG